MIGLILKYNCIIQNNSYKLPVFKQFDAKFISRLCFVTLFPAPGYRQNTRSRNPS